MGTWTPVLPKGLDGIARAEDEEGPSEVPAWAAPEPGRAPAAAAAPALATKVLREIRFESWLFRSSLMSSSPSFRRSGFRFFRFGTCQVAYTTAIPWVAYASAIL
jgi:hypothetical protein